ncbi:MAG: hypothetical protein J6Y37_04630 [Paludibacteraceae bacterium]|nr:hypothetical protein [Paludibacteraceae bacterium]
MDKRLLTSFFALWIAAFAYSEKQVLINGTAADRSDVGDITFQGDDLLLTYSDGSSFRLDMESVVINFSDVTSSGGSLSSILSLNTIVGESIWLTGVEEGTPIQIIGVDGKIFYSSRAENSDFSISVATLPSSPYLIKIGDQIIKFIKK